jgi:hypothetical protein
MPALAVDAERGGFAGSGMGTGTGCESFGGEGSGDKIRTGAVTVMGSGTLYSGGSVIPGALPPPSPVVVVVLGEGEWRLPVVRL